MYQQLTLNIKREEEISEEDLWDFDNFNWLKGNPANLRIFFTSSSVAQPCKRSGGPYFKRRWGDGAGQLPGG